MPHRSPGRLAEPHGNRRQRVWRSSADRAANPTMCRAYKIFEGERVLITAGQQDYRSPVRS